jgi:hypothetical protein
LSILVSGQYLLLCAYLLIFNLVAVGEFYGFKAQNNALANLFLSLCIINFLIDLGFALAIAYLFCFLRREYLKSHGKSFKSQGQCLITVVASLIGSLLVINTGFNSCVKAYCVQYDVRNETDERLDGSILFVSQLLQV